MPLTKPKSPQKKSGKHVAVRHALVRGPSDEPSHDDESPNDESPDGASAAATSHDEPNADGTPTPTTLCVDIGGTGIKMIALDGRGRPLNERCRMLTPHPSPPAAVLPVVASMLPAQPHFDRVAVGFPGVVINGVVWTAANLGADAWHGYNLQQELERLASAPARVINDADLQGCGVADGKGVELVLTLGTGLGSALFVNGHLVPNLELGHHPFKKGATYEERVCDAELKRIGRKHWSRRVQEALEQLNLTFNPRVIHLGGGNVSHLRGDLPKNVHTFTNVEGMTGGIKLWANG